MEKKYIRKQSIIAANLNGEVVMLDGDTGKYYNLGQVGGIIWGLLDRELTVGELVAALTEKYDVTEEQCRTDVLPFLEQLVKKGLVTEK